MYPKTLLLPLLAAAAAQAQTTAPEPSSSLTANIAVTTKYKFRGQDQGNTQWFSPALQGGFDWTSGGVYVGNWNSNVNFSNAAIEMDFYAGYKGEFRPGFGYDVGILQYYYPQHDKAVDFDTTEIYGGVTFNVLSLKYFHTISKDYFGIGEIKQQAGAAGGRPKGRNTGYLDLTANVPLVEKLTLNAHVGYTRLAGNLRNGSDGSGLGYPSFYDYKLGVTYDVGAFLGTGTSVAAAVVGADKRGFYGDFNKPRLILTISKAL